MTLPDVYISEIGNTSGASVMFGLEYALSKGYVHRAPRLFLGAFGVGLNVNAAPLSPIGDPREITRSANSACSRPISNESDYSGDAVAISFSWAGRLPSLSPAKGGG